MPALRIPIRTARPMLLLALVAILASCGSSGEDPEANRPAKPSAVEIRELISSAEMYEATIRFPEPRRVLREHDGTTYTELIFDGLEVGTALGSHGSVGMPAIQMMYRNVAVPRGATPRLEVLEVKTEVLSGLLLHPHQQSPVDGEGERPPVPDGELPPPEVFVDCPFTIDEKAYASDTTRPGAPVTTLSIGRMRDLELLQVAIAPLRYNAARREAILQTEVTFRISFDGGASAFLPPQAADPFEMPNFAPLHRAAALNGNLLYPELTWVPTLLERLGAELLILTPPEFLSHAQALASWKREKGITTQVYRVESADNGGVGTSKEEIRDFLRARYEKAIPRPSYVLLFGDAEFIPPFYRSTLYSSRTGTDLDYSLMTPGDRLADLGVGRISVDTAAEAQVVVDKIIGYEKTPPFAPTGFYDRAVIAAYFQAAMSDIPQEGVTSRGYIQISERIRSALVALGYDVDRLYTTDTTYHDEYTGDPTPRRYRNLSFLPSAIGGGSGFPWSAGTSDVTDAINEGCFLLIHRDHGGKNGWSRPRFRTSDVASLTNGSLLPVLFSVDCSTGLFDNETAAGDYTSDFDTLYFLEALLRLEGGGVVGALGDTRDSPTWANNALTRGFADAVFPSVIPSVGAATPIRRLADILNYGKLYMFTQVGLNQAGDDTGVTQAAADSNNILWHVFGDPTLELWTERPFALPRDVGLGLLGRQLSVEYPIEGAIITVQQGALAMGRAAIENGRARIELFTEPTPQIPLVVSASALNAVATELQEVPR